MDCNRWFPRAIGVFIILLLVPWANKVVAQGGKPLRTGITFQSLAPATAIGPDVPLGTTFSFQGLLKTSGVPYNGTCDMQFTLWNGYPGSGGISLSTVPALNSPTPVSNGLFTAFIDFGNQFQGNYREIEPQVRCPNGVGSFLSLGVQTIYAAPYALGLLPGARIAGPVSNALIVDSTAFQGTGIQGEAHNGNNAWGVFGYSTTGIGVVASSDDNVSAPHTALKINGGRLTVGGSVKPAFIFTTTVVSSTCASFLNVLVDGDPNAMIFVTPRQTTGTVPATDVRVLYGAPFWYLCSPSLASGMSYNILVINQ